MNKLFRPKCMRRMAVFMALVAPIVYLFGSLFFALNGAHGTQVFADTENANVSEPSQVYFNQILTTNRVQSTFSANSYPTLAWSRPSLVTVGDKIAFLFSGFINPSGSNPVYYLNTINQQSGIALNSVFTVSSIVYTSDTLSLNAIITSSTVIDGYFSMVNLTRAYGAGNEPTFDEFREQFTKPYYPFNEGEVVYFGQSPDNYSDYIFKNFFAKDNFLVQWGKNAISENPYGFAPFGYFWRYLDTNFLHMSNEQVGLMGYGYMYYAAHVLLFDVGFILVTFFINVIQKVTDKIGGGDL